MSNGAETPNMLVPIASMSWNWSGLSSAMTATIASDENGTTDVMDTCRALGSCCLAGVAKSGSTTCLWPLPSRDADEDDEADDIAEGILCCSSLLCMYAP
jgi:hypothetical protein